MAGNVFLESQAPTALALTALCAAASIGMKESEHPNGMNESGGPGARAHGHTERAGESVGARRNFSEKHFCFNYNLR